MLYYNEPYLYYFFLSKNKLIKKIIELGDCNFQVKGVTIAVTNKKETINKEYIVCCLL